MESFYRSLNCFVCPSKYEAFGRVAPEAMNYKIPTIVSNNVGASDIIKDGENGYTYDKYPELKVKVEYLIKNAEARSKLGKNAYLYITQKWTSTIAANNLIKLFESILYGKEFDVKDGPASKQTKI